MSTPPSPERCAATYVVQHMAGHIVIFAIGVHHVAGCVVFFRREPGEDFPPRFSLWHLRSDEPELHVLTPFAATTSFQTTRKIDGVEVLDAHGSRTITVDDIQDRPRGICLARLPPSTLSLTFQTHYLPSHRTDNRCVRNRGLPRLFTQTHGWRD